MEDHTKCPYCFSTDIEIVSSYARRDAVVIACRQCGKESQLDTENPNVDLNDPSQRVDEGRE